MDEQFTPACRSFTLKYGGYSWKFRMFTFRWEMEIKAPAHEQLPVLRLRMWNSEPPLPFACDPSPQPRAQVKLLHSPTLGH